MHWGATKSPKLCPACSTPSTASMALISTLIPWGMPLVMVVLMVRAQRPDYPPPPLVKLRPGSPKITVPTGGGGAYSRDKGQPMRTLTLPLNFVVS